MSDPVSRAKEIAFSQNGRADPEKPTLLFIHGAGGQRPDWPQAWRGAAPAFKGFNSLSIDLPGHGASPKPGCASVEDYAAIIAAFMDLHDLKNVVPVGHSMGVAITLCLAAERNPRLKAAILIAGAARFFVQDQMLAGFKSHFEKTVDAVVSYSWPPRARELYMRGQRWHMRMAGPQVVHDDFLACQKADYRDRLADITLPVLAIASKSDRMVRHKDIAAMVETLSDARLFSVSNTGHFPQIEKRALLEKQMLDFLNAL